MRTLICLNMGNGGRVVSGCVFSLDEIPGVCVCVCGLCVHCTYR